MTDNPATSISLSGLIISRLNAGFIPDADTLHFLRSSCGVNGDVELLTFLEDSSLNDGTIYELAIYPDDHFLLLVERELPLSGITPAEIEDIIKQIESSTPQLSIVTASGNHLLDPECTLSCAASFIKKLNLDLDLSYTGIQEDASSEDNYYKARVLLRRKKFLPSEDRGNFMKRLIQHKPVFQIDEAGIIKLVERGISLLSGTDGKALDALAAKKYFCESVISQSEEFASLLKTWGMEFLMMKRIQPPAASAEEALETIRDIDRLTSIVYGVIIPPSDIAVQMSINRDDPGTDIFR